MRILGCALVALAAFGTQQAFAQVHSSATPPAYAVPALPDPAVTSQQLYLQNELARQSTQQENASSRAQVNNLLQENQALRDQQSLRSQAVPNSYDESR